VPDDTSPGAQLYDRARVDRAIAGFRGMSLNPVEAMLASFELSRDYLKQFRTLARQLRREKGDAVMADFARLELNDIIADLQDAVAPTVRTYNALLRDPDDEGVPGS
jgi:hypothetical protein